MFDFIKNLQNKPEHIKVKILYFLAGLTIVFVLMIWVSSFEEYKTAFQTPIGNNEAVINLKASVLDSIMEEDTRTQENKDTNKSQISNLKSQNDGVEEEKNSRDEKSQNNNKEELQVISSDGQINLQQEEKEDNKYFMLPVE